MTGLIVSMDHTTGVSMDLFLWLPSFLFGCLGAVIPELVRQRDLAEQEAKSPPRYLVYSALLVLASGAVVLALPGQLSGLTAIYAGAAAPLIVSKGAEQVVATIGNRSNGPGYGTAGGSPSDVTVDSLEWSDASEQYVLMGRPLRPVSMTGLLRFILSL